MQPSAEHVGELHIFLYLPLGTAQEPSYPTSSFREVECNQSVYGRV